MVFLFVGAGAVAIDTAGEFSGLSLKGIAEPAMVVATGTVALVICGAATDPNFSLLALKGAAGFAAVVATGDELPVVFLGLESIWAFAGGAAEGAAKVFDGEPSSFLFAA